MNEICKKIHDIGIVPVIALDRVEDAAPLARALCKGGLPVAEVTYRTASSSQPTRHTCSNFWLSFVKP